MNVRAIAVIAPSRRWVKRTQVASRFAMCARRPRRRLWARFADDRQLIGLKVVLLVGLLLGAFALEVL